MDLFSTIQKSIHELQRLNSQRENIKITTSFIIKRLFEEAVSNYPTTQIATLSPRGNKIFGVEISFNHFSNDIVIYDETRACIDERFKITITPQNNFVFQKPQEI
jgi:hypothetical protein